MHWDDEDSDYLNVNDLHPNCRMSIHKNPQFRYKCVLEWEENAHQMISLEISLAEDPRRQGLLVDKL